VRQEFEEGKVFQAETKVALAAMLGLPVETG